MIAPSDDLDQIMAVMTAAFDPAFGEAWNRKQVEDALILGNCHYLMVAANGEAAADLPAVGFCLFRDGFGEAELLLISVDPIHRGKGLGQILLTRFEISSRALGAGRLLLEMRKGNPAESLYRRLGYTIVGERRDYYRMSGGGRADALTFARILA